MKALFIGGTGVISSAVTPLAVERGFQMTLLNRGETRLDTIPKGVKVIKADIRDAGAAKKALGKKEYDVVVNWITFTEEQVKLGVELFKGRCGQYIFISTCMVYLKPPVSPVVTEGYPRGNPYSQYARDKIVCEDILEKERNENGFPATVVRPSYTYCPSLMPLAYQSWSHPYTVIDRMRKGKPVIVHGDGTSLWTLTHHADFAKGFVGLMGNAGTIGHAFHITSDELLTWDAIYREVGRAAGAEPKIVHITSDQIISHYPDEDGGLLGDKSHSIIFDNSKIKSFVPGFVATVPFRQGAKECVAYLDADKKRRGIDEEANRRWDALIERYGKR